MVVSTYPMSDTSHVFIYSISYHLQSPVRRVDVGLLYSRDTGIALLGCKLCAFQAEVSTLAGTQVLDFIFFPTLTACSNNPAPAPFRSALHSIQSMTATVCLHRSRTGLLRFSDPQPLPHP